MRHMSVVRCFGALHLTAPRQQLKSPLLLPFSFNNPHIQGLPVIGDARRQGHVHFSTDRLSQKTNPGQAIFVNRSLYLEKIKFYGFDLDYTLAEYKSPEYEKLGFQLTKERMVEIGYPPDIATLQYDSAYPVRGLWFDYQRGNLLKVDGYGNILFCQHGFNFYNKREILEVYPNKFIKLDERRTYVFDTLFNLPETYLLAGLVDYFGKHEDYTETRDGFMCGDLDMSYKSIFHDVRASVDHVHRSGVMKEATCQDLSKYIRKDSRLPHVLNNIRTAGAKTFIVTNSDWWYTDKVMDYILEFPDAPHAGKSWQSYFDYVFVDAKKPIFFGEGTVLRKVDENTGNLKITGGLHEGNVFSGGNFEVLSKMIKAKGRDVLYVGDHIFGDVLKSKKQAGWRTFLIVPELNDELNVWSNEQKLFEKLLTHDKELSEYSINLDNTNREKIENLKSTMRDLSHTMEMEYGRSGSLFRSGSRQTFFASQVDRYADIYSGSLLNLLYYPLSYMFRAPPMLLPHELTEEGFDMDDSDVDNESNAKS